MRVIYYTVLLFFLLQQPDAFCQNKESLSLSYGDETLSIKKIQRLKALKYEQPYHSWQRLQQLLEESQILRQRELTLQCLTALSSFTDDPGLMDQALRFARQGISLCDTVLHRKSLFTFYNNIGTLYFNQGHYLESYKVRIKSIRYVKDDPLALARAENNMMPILRILGKHESGISMLERCVSVGIHYKDGQLWANALQNIACLKEELGDTSCTSYLDSSIRVAEKFNQFDILYRGLINKSVFLSGSEKNLATALRQLEAADTLLRHITPPARSLAKADEVRGIILMKLGQYHLAEQKLRKSLARASQDDRHRIINVLAVLYAQQGDFEKAYYISRQPIEAFASTRRQETLLSLNNMEFQYRTAEKDKQLAENRLMLIQKDNALKWKNTGMGLLAAGGITLSGIILLLRRNYHQKQKIQLAEQINLQLKARIEGEERERKRISQELHDGIGGILAAAKMNLSGVDALIPEQIPKYEQGVHLLDEAHKELRQTAHNLSPHMLKVKGLAPTLHSFCKKTAAAKKMDIRLQCLGLLEELHEETALTAYRIVQELVQNIVKHSGASVAIVQLNYQESHLDITVEDNGKGIAGSQPDAGIGLSNIRDRIAALNGHMEIDSRPGEGTTIYINIEEHFLEC